MSKSLVITSGTLKSRVINAEGRKVLLTGGGFEITLTGHCPELRVIGNSYLIWTENVDVIDLQGNDNFVEAHTLGSVRFRGENNALVWKNAQTGRLSPNFTLNGEGNSVSRCQSIG
jgi:Protein of unknown function (DUF3060)